VITAATSAALISAAEGESVEGIQLLIPEFYDIFWSFVCFVILFVLFWRIVLPKMKVLLDERSAAIEGNIAKADEAQRQAEAALEQYTAQLAEARHEAGRIREAAREDGKQIVAEARNVATVEAQRVTVSAQAQIEAERQAALVSLRSEVGTLAIDLAGNVIGETLADDAKATAIVDRFLADLNALEKSKSAFTDTSGAR
jgi:F-type H+-transporting ATPase subunit b